jgi:hypothetical protein
VIGDHYPLWRLVLQLHLQLQSQGMQLQMQLNERVFGCGDGREGVAGMEQISNGVRADRIEGVVWTKSRHSAPGGNCVEVAELPGGGVAVRNSRDPKGPALVYTRAELAAFVAGAKDGEFDAMVD